ncbi:MAG: hypothetical protein N3E42_04470 [Candidatus Bipolaricaulota bacterium]|nr:hypothetical protein [Candidatus Bipolaricaulota bacterium]
MFQRFMVFGSLTVLMLSGCDLAQSPELPPLPQSCDAVPSRHDFFYEPYLKVAQRVPAFGGLFFDEQNNNIIYVYLTDPSQEEAAKQAILEVFFRPNDPYLSPREFRILPARYTFVQLTKWWECLPVIRGMTSSGLQVDKNRIRIGVDNTLSAARRRKVVEAIETVLERLSIPREAVIIEFEAPAVPKMEQR